MSGAGETRWSRRPGQQGNRQNQDARSGTNTPAKDGGRQQAMAVLSGNVWAGQQKGKPAGGGDRGAAQPAPGPTHVPVKDFNSAEVREFLKKKYVESIGDRSAVHHKVQGDSVAKRGSGVWSAKGNMTHLMPNGQNFIDQLKKQLAALEQGKTS